ncbi:cytochrome P450 3A24-like isoform X2 [Dermacentor variabilis]|uniref:cytochrome P450 3A24-like isoform X2 n=1 Tax=Dermacentor variabilis TaxID=34621 RepID=UPI003F5C0480
MPQITVVVLLAALVAALYLSRRRRFSLFRRLGVPGPPPNLISGNIPEIKAQGSTVAFSNWTKQYGDIVGFFNGAAPFLLVKDVDLLKKVLIEDFQVFPDRGNIMGVLPAPINPEALVFVASVHRWKSLRGAISPAFTTSKLTQAFKVFETSSEALADIVGKQRAVDRSVDAMLLLRRYALDTILKAGFGIDMGVQKAEPGGFWDKLTLESSRLFDSLGLQGITLLANCLPELQPLFVWLATVTTWCTDMFVALVKDLVEPVIERRREMNSNKACDILQVLLKSEEVDAAAGNQVHNRLSRAEILVNACVLVSAGLDSTVHAVICALYSVATHMDIQERLRKEIHATLKEEGQLTYHCLGRMKYLDMVIKESMRLYSQTVGFVARRAVSDYTYKDLLIPKGVSIVAAASCLHVDPDIWSDPTVFDPERFSDENKAGINPISYLAFGSGPRNCVGRAFATLNVKTVTATLLSRYRVRMDEERHKEGLEFRSNLIITCLPSSVWFKFEKL